MSQYGGGGFYENQGGSPSPYSSPSAKKGDVQQTLRAFPIAKLSSATQAHNDAEWKIDDREVGQITIVAQVVSIARQPTNHVYHLQDGTGQIEARRWIASSDDDGTRQSDIVENKYVRVSGGLKSFGKKRYININSIRPITQPHELFFHLLESLTVYMNLTRGPPNNTGGTPSVKADGSSSMSNYAAQHAEVPDQFANLPTMKRNIIQFILSQPEREEGIHVGHVARSMGLPPGDAHTISVALDELMDEGHVFTTIDDSHFNVSM